DKARESQQTIQQPPLEVPNTQDYLILRELDSNVKTNKKLLMATLVFSLFTLLALVGIFAMNI
ncbi:unnamed protein product, partial [marine sediment metagenome]